jgi:hypothetical protein
MDEPFFINSEVRKELGDRREYRFQAYSGVDIRAVIYLPLLTKGSISNAAAKKFKIFADLQTISISSTRSVSPVRVLGRASPFAWTRGARTFAGTMVFASLNTDPFSEIYDVSMAEAALSSSTSIVSDQMPPFSVVLTASNEKGAAAMQMIHGITLTNYGTTYSVDDLYTETTYTFVATDVIPLVADNAAVANARARANYEEVAAGMKSISQLVAESLSAAYGTLGHYANAVRRRVDDAGILNASIPGIVNNFGLRRD